MSKPTIAEGSPTDSVYACLEVLEDATGLLKSAKASDFSYYYLGVLPFLWLLVEFWADMSRGAQASQHLWPSACLLAVAYVWMKIGQALFVQRLLLILRAEERHWSLRELLRMARRAALVQSSALAVTCFASCLLIPTAWTFAFYHHALCSCDPDHPDTITSVRAALRQSQLWPRQNHAMLSVHASFGLTVFVNVWALMVFLPQLLHSLTGVETQFLVAARSPLNSTLILSAAVVTLALADPWLKAAYAVRAFRAQSITTGRDLAVAWRKIPRSTLLGFIVVGCLFMLPRMAVAQSPQTWSDESDSSNAVTQGTSSLAMPQTATSEPNETGASELGPEAQKLDRQLNTVLEKPDFAWHLPREIEAENEPNPSWLTHWLQGVIGSMGSGIKAALRWIERIAKWLFGTGDSTDVPVSSDASGWGNIADRGTILLAAIAVLLPLIALMRRKWRRRVPTITSINSAKVESRVLSEGLEAAKRPESEWASLAEQLLKSGERRLALRALFLGNLACLIHAGYLTAAAHKSVGDYRRDLKTRSHACPLAFRGFCDVAAIFESIWYGNYPVTDTALEEFSRGSALMRQDV